MTLRVGSGELKGRRLAVPKGMARFSSARTKKAIFDFLSPYLTGARVLDLFAGTGGLGIEALSRGAGFCLFVESDRTAAAALRKNLALFAFGRYEVRQQDFRRALEKLFAAGERFDVVLADPPYRQEFLDELSAVLSRGAILNPSGILAVEHSKKQNFPAPSNLLFWQARRQGDSSVSYFRQTV